MSYLSTPPFRAATRALTVGMLGALLALGLVPAHAQLNGAIYTCTDAAGRKLTSDRPIASCLDRDQRMLSRQGLVLQVIPPELTGAQRAAQQEKDRQAAQAQERQRDQDRFDRALIARYPTRAAHEAARRDALTQPQKALDDAKQELIDLQRQRGALSGQMQSYRQDPDQTPAKLRHDVTSNAVAIGTQQQLIASLQTSVDRINAQFDAENQRLSALWPTLTTNAMTVAP